MTTRRIRLLVLAGAGAMLLGGCGDSGSASDASPLQAIWGEPESPAESRAKQLQHEEIVAQCMKDEGWEYHPVDWSAQMPDQEYEDPNEPGFGERHGYGVVYSYELYELPYIDEDGNQTGDGPMGRDFEDPNMEYVEELTDSEREEYYIALQGDQMNQMPEIDPESGEEIWIAPPPEEQGCYGVASLEVYGDQPWSDQDFNERFSELTEQMANDPAIEDAEITWSDCMYDIDDSYDFFGPDDTWMYVDTILNEAKGLERVDVDPETGEVIGGDGEQPTNGWMSDGDGNAWGYTGTQRRPSEAQLASVKEQEVSLWKADQKCQEESGLKDLRRRFEQDIVDAIREEFPELIRGDD